MTTIYEIEDSIRNDFQKSAGKLKGGGFFDFSQPAGNPEDDGVSKSRQFSVLSDDDAKLLEQKIGSTQNNLVNS
ncbi:MAG: hypothetical protein K9G62_07330 [Alphaproteobacteria bacterium]|nr:hypothetical protein [Alphaproteobacteria bacterium]